MIRRQFHDEDIIDGLMTEGVCSFLPCLPLHLEVGEVFFELADADEWIADVLFLYGDSVPGHNRRYEKAPVYNSGALRFLSDLTISGG